MREEKNNPKRGVQEFEPLLDSHQAAELMHVHPETVKRRARRGEIPGIKLGKIWRFRAFGLETFNSQINGLIFDLSRLNYGTLNQRSVANETRGQHVSKGTVSTRNDRVKRKQKPDCWIFRWLETDVNGKRIRRKVILGTVKEYPTEASALKAAESLRITINGEQPQPSQQPVSVAALVKHFKEHELGPLDEDQEDDDEGRAYSTSSNYVDILDFHVAPKWGNKTLREVRTVAVEKWLRKLDLARGSKAKIAAL